ncbi:hypothetical protein K1T71_006978 [Dendrolimus kikuchii]|uniref:Uncharacterized protein n=1 Tax=Dendrolimus kikuchii TaxID=765133 RepID=A0ACC1CZ25_9NEOP|nr:hypothetical protein K1T71_006978 [Dendrolimus kikuchii]
MNNNLVYLFIMQLVNNIISKSYEMEISEEIKIIDLSRGTTWRDMEQYYGALERRCDVRSLKNRRACMTRVMNVKEAGEVCKNKPKWRSVVRLSYELAEWIATNLSHVVGVATDAPTLESDQTREFSARTVSNLLGKNGVFMIENVNIERKIPEQGCMALVMPLKLHNVNHVPTRLTAFCPSIKTDLRVALALKKAEKNKKLETISSRVYDVNLEEILNQ